MAGTETKRIIELTEASTVQSGDFIAVDSNARGTKKVSTDALATSAALTAETNARAGADEQMSERMDGIEEQTALIQNPTKTLSGALVSFTDGADMPMVACTASIVPKQSGSGTPSPSNVRAISGWESVQTSVSGKNLLENTGTSRTSAGVTYTVNSDGSVTANGTATGNYSFFPIAQFPLKAGVTYALNGCPEGGSNSTYQIAVTGAAGMYDTGSGATCTPTVDGIGTVRIYVYGGQTVNNLTFYPMLRLASDTDPTYEPYNGHTTTTSLGRTVYGGTLDVVSGELTDKMGIVDMGTLDWRDYTAGSNHIFGATIADKAYTWNFISSVFPNVEKIRTNLEDNEMGCYNAGALTTVCIRADAYNSDANAFKSAVSGQTLVYELATPQTYQLTPTEVSTLLGENNVWADSGDVEITYRRDISIVLENLENALNGSNSLNAMMMSAPTENTAEEPTEDETEDDMR